MKIGIIGAGLIGKKRSDAIRVLGGDRHIIAVCDIDIEKALRIAQEWKAEVFRDWQELLLSDLDAVVVSTSNDSLKDISIAALQNGKHVLCEKPLGRNVQEALAIYSKARESGKILKTGFNHRHHPAIWKAKSLITEDQLGPIFFIRCVYGHGGRPGYENEWRASRELCGGGELLDQGVHVVDLFRWFLGEFTSAFGLTRTFNWNMEVEDNAFAVFRTEKGQVASMHTSWTQWKNQFLFEVFGKKGFLVIDGLGGSYGTETLKVGRRRYKENRYLGGTPEEEIFKYPGPDISWIEEWKEFESAIQERRDPLGSGFDGLMAIRMIESVYESAKSNKPVDIN